MKKITILLATYNGERYLEEQLESLILQKNVIFKILVRDDGSTDGTLDILRRWEKNGQLTWYSGTHTGVQMGYYELMKKAGEYESDFFAFCDQDDRWDPDKLETAVKELSQFPDTMPALYYSGQRLTDENLVFISNHRLNEKRDRKSRYVITDIAGCTAVFNRSLLYKVLEYEPKYMLMHDSWLYRVCISTGGNVKIDSRPHMDYRQHGKNTFGMGVGIVGKIIHGMHYLTKLSVEKEIREVRKGYYSQMTPEYKALTDEVCGYKKHFRFKRRLLNSRYINFYNRGLNFTYKVKVLLNKL